MASEAVAARLSAPRPQMMPKRPSAETVVVPAPSGSDEGQDRIVRPDDRDDHLRVPLPATPAGVVPLAAVLAEAAPPSDVVPRGWPAVAVRDPLGLPSELGWAVNDPSPSAREAAVAELARLAVGPDVSVADAARTALGRLQNDDSRRVAAAASAALGHLAPRPPDHLDRPSPAVDSVPPAGLPATPEAAPPSLAQPPAMGWAPPPATWSQPPPSAAWPSAAPQYPPPVAGSGWVQPIPYLPPSGQMGAPAGVVQPLLPPVQTSWHDAAGLSTGPGGPRYAEFWKRVGAWIVDATLLFSAPP
jgi:hypothetical protein